VRRRVLPELPPIRVAEFAPADRPQNPFGTIRRMPPPARTRLDVALVERGLVESRSRAQALVMAGRVLVDGTAAAKAGTPVSAQSRLELVAPPRFVSRGGDKLQTAFERFDLDVRGARCIDVGASTGGFTDCLLAHGAAAVAALDVGRGQLHERLAGDPRVTVLDAVNARHLQPSGLPFAPAFACLDVSFISLRLVLPPVLACCTSPWQAVALVKPQFEAGRRHLRRGVVRDPAVRAEVLHELASFVTAGGHVILGVCDSLYPGPAGNREYLLHVASAGHPRIPAHPIDVDAQIADAAAEPG
jgi:23S rRNA (cytidine1920-2'-O)/16S rRNA (cytidine1409-2'-O)-methyltransferase